MRGYPGHFVTAPPAWNFAPPMMPGAVEPGGGNDAGFDAALVAAAMGSGPQAEQAMRLLTLQVLSRLGGSREAKRDDGSRDFQDHAFRLLCGGGGGRRRSGGGDIGPDAGARDGLAQLLRIQQAIKKDPRPISTSACEDSWVAYQASVH